MTVYEVYQDDAGKFVLYEVGDHGTFPVAWFVVEADAEFAREAFARRADQEK